MRAADRGHGRRNGAGLVDAVVVFAPSDVVWVGVTSDGRQTSHWTLDRLPLPFVALLKYGVRTATRRASEPYTRCREPAADYWGSDSFTYTVADVHGATDTATVTVTVEAGPAPVADSATIAFQTPTAVDVLANGADGAVIAAMDTTPAHGAAAIDDDGALQYSPDSGYTVLDSLTYRLVGAPYVATVSLTVALPGPERHGRRRHRGPRHRHARRRAQQRQIAATLAAPQAGRLADRLADAARGRLIDVDGRTCCRVAYAGVADAPISTTVIAMMNARHPAEWSHIRRRR
jgi:hypothetical protein